MHRKQWEHAGITSSSLPEGSMLMAGKLRQSVKRVSTSEIYRVQKAPVLIAYGTVAIEEAVVLARNYAGPEPGMVVAGITRQGNPKRWHFGLSYRGEQFAWVSTFRLLNETDDQIAHVVEAAREGRIQDNASIVELVAELTGEAEDAMLA
jgi:hypothetical protein